MFTPTELTYMKDVLLEKKKTILGKTQQIKFRYENPSLETNLSKFEYEEVMKRHSDELAKVQYLLDKLNEAC